MGKMQSHFHCNRDIPCDIHTPHTASEMSCLLLFARDKDLDYGLVYNIKISHSCDVLPFYPHLILLGYLAFC